MPKLFNLREWLTVEETVRRFSTALNEEVSEADVLRLALDEELRLSVNFVNATKARRGKVVGPEEKKWGEYEYQGKSYTYLASIDLGGERFLNCDDNEIYIDGVWTCP